jgi:hypothetical protein
MSSYRVAAMIPFGHVSTELMLLRGIAISKDTAWRIAESMGERIKDERQEREQLFLSGALKSPDVVRVGVGEYIEYMHGNDVFSVFVILKRSGLCYNLSVACNAHCAQGQVFCSED